jgi:hypothetical protein
LANFGIQIADLCYQLPVSAVGSGLVSVGIVRPLTSRKKNTVKQPFVLHSHLVSEAPADKTKDDRVQRRTYQFTDNDLQKIVKGGQIPSIKELMKQALVDEDTLPEVQQDTVDAVDLEAETDFVKDKTFLTGVGIVEEHIPSWYTNYLDEEIDAPLPLTITESVKALRIALKNPSAIWRTSQTEKSKLKAFAGFKISRNSNAPKLPVDELEEMEELMRNVDVQVHAMQNKLSQVLNKVQV